MDFGEFDDIDEDSSLRVGLHEVHKDVLLWQQEEANLSNNDASGYDLNDFEVAVTFWLETKCFQELSQSTVCLQQNLKWDR